MVVKGIRFKEIVNVVGILSPVVIFFVNSIFVVRNLGLENFGLYLGYMAYLNYLGVISNPLGDYALRFGNSETIQKVLGIFSLVFILRLACGFILLFLVLGANPITLTILGISSCQAFINPITQIYYSRSWKENIIFLNLLVPVVILVLNIILYVNGINEFSQWLLMLFAVNFIFLTYIICTLMLKSRDFICLKNNNDVLKYVTPFLFTNLLSVNKNNLIPVLISSSGRPEALVTYEVIKKIYVQIQQAGPKVLNAYFLNLDKIISNSGISSLLSRYIAIGSFVSFIPLFAYTLIANIYTFDLNLVRFVVVVLAFDTVILLCGQIYNLGLKVQYRSKWIMIASLLRFLIGTPMIFISLAFLGPKYFIVAKIFESTVLVAALIYFYKSRD